MQNDEAWESPGLAEQEETGAVEGPDSAQVVKHKQRSVAFPKFFMCKRGRSASEAALYK